MPTLKIDGKDITVESGTTIFQAAKKLGISIPHYCYHAALKPDGNCRMCFVEIEGRPKLEISCRTLVQEGLVVHTNSPKVLEGRRYVMEFFLINHPLDCPECDQAGECKLQDYSFKHGPGHSRYKEPKRILPYKDLGPHIVLYTTRCIMCKRCVRFCNEIVGVPELRVFEHGNLTQIDIYPGKPLANPLSGNVVDLCPVGALIDKDFLHKTRVWNLSSTKSICPRCATGCNILIDVKDNQIQRLKPRLNPGVNSYWICDEGRYGYHEWETVNHAVHPLIDKGNQSVSWTDAYKKVVEGFKKVIAKHGPESVAGIGSAAATNEENFLLRRLITHVMGGNTVALYQFDGRQEDQKFKSGFIISHDKNPNSTGARISLGLNSGVGDIQDLIQNISSGTIKAVYFLIQDWRNGISDELLKVFKKLNFLVIQNVAINPVTQHADVILPSANYAENTGTLVNRTGRLQKIAPALIPPGEVKPGWQILANLFSEFGSTEHYVTIDAVFSKMAETISCFSGITFQNIVEQEIQLKDLDEINK